MTSQQPSVPWPTKAADAPQPNILLPKLPSSLSDNSSLLTPDTLGSTPGDPHVTKRPGRVTDNTIPIPDTNTNLMSDLNDPDDHHSALSSSAGNIDVHQFECRFRDAKAERRHLRLFVQKQQTLMENMSAELKIVNERWEIEKQKR